MRILVIEDDVVFGNLISKFLVKQKWEVTLVTRAADIEAKLRSESFHIILSDQQLPDGKGIDLIKLYKQYQPEIPVIIITAHKDVRLAVQALKEGASDYITKPVLPDELKTLIENYASKSETTPNKNQKKDAPIPSKKSYIKGGSSAMKELEKQIELVAPTNYSVFIQGDSGTGKEYISKRIHELSPRSGNNFVAIDCGAISNELAAGEFFGHTKGAYTGATDDKAGVFEQADNGTIFLDEIGNLSYENQIKLLRVLQERTVRRLGSDKNINVDVRVISATNENIRELVSQNRFREDLYHRLAEFNLLVPSLKERENDLEIYIQNFIESTTHELNKKLMICTPEALNALKVYPWPGNLRELKNVIRKAVLISQSKEIELIHLPVEIRLNYVSNKDVKPTQVNELKKHTADLERQHLLNMLEKHHYNKTKVAAVLGIDRKTLYNKLNKMGLTDIIQNRFS